MELVTKDGTGMGNDTFYITLTIDLIDIFEALDCES